jgi:predicted permease
MRELATDLSFAFRMMRKAPFVTAVALLSLALGIGANATVYAWLRGAVLRPLGGVADQGRIIVLSTVTRNKQLIEVSYPDYRDFRDGQHQAELAASRTEPVSWRGGGPPQRIWAEAASGNFFQVSGARPALGRLLQPADDQQGQPVVAVLGNAFWRNRLAADPAIVGKSLRINGLDAAVIGVAAEGFQAAPEGGVSMDVFVPLSPFQRAMGRGLENRGNRSLKIMGRLAPRAGVAQAQAAVEAVAKDLALKFPDEDRGLGVKVAPLSEAPWGSQGVLAPALRLLLVAVGLILLLACANVASLLLTRAVGRQQEFSIRAALGAGRGRLARQMLTESLLLGLLGGALGLIASIWATGLLQRLMPPTDKPVSLHAALDGSVLAFAMLVSVAAGLLLGCLPVLTSRLTPSAEALKEGGARASSAPRARRWLGALVVGEMALATMLLAGAGLTIRSLGHASQVKLGFDPSHVLLAGIELNAAAYPPAKAAAFTRQVLDRLRATPGVESAAFGTFAPLGLEGGSWEDLSFEGYTPAPDESLKLYGNTLSPGYFSTLRIPILEGRDFNDQDRRDSQPAIILSEAAARRYFPNGALGHRVKQGDDWRTVVGVAADIKVHHLAEPPQAFAYYPLTQRHTTGLTLHVRASGNPAALLPAVRQAVADADPDQPLVALPMADYLKASTLLLRMAASLLALLGGLALLLACLGIFAVMSFSVAQRGQEMGVRMALGAAPKQLLSLVLSEGMLLAGAGALIGLLLIALVAPGMGPLLVQVSPRDPLTLAGVPLLLLAVAFMACALPALRASRTNPAAALHSA